MSEYKTPLEIRHLVTYEARKPENHESWITIKGIGLGKKEAFYIHPTLRHIAVQIQSTSRIFILTMITQTKDELPENLVLLKWKAFNSKFDIYFYLLQF